MDILPFFHRLVHMGEKDEVLIEGEPTIKKVTVQEVQDVPPIRLREITKPEVKIEKHRRALDLFSGLGSLVRVLHVHCFEVVTFDIEPSKKPEKCVDISTWDFRREFQECEFDLVTANQPRAEATS